MTPKKMLLAEDDADDRQFFYDFLKHRSDLVLLPAVENGVAVFDYLERATKANLPDVIILDQNMPRRNGLQTLALLKESAAYAHIPVMVYSTYVDESLVQRSTTLGATLVWVKPSDIEGYHKMIDQFFNTIP
jgi:CheY-like chemotaxis protein